MNLEISARPARADILRISRSIFSKKLGGRAIDPWASQGDHSFYLSMTSWSMAALADAIASRTGRAARIWLPEYFCDQAVWFLRERRVDLLFYPVDMCGQPNWEYLQKSDNKSDIFILVHYFGHPNQTSSARLFCDQRGLLMVEDATHAIGGIQGIGQVRDVVLYSIWKFFPLANGAVISVRPQALLNVTEIAHAIEGLGRGRALGLNWAARAFLSPLSRKVATELDRDFAKRTISKPLTSGPRPSPFSAWMLTSDDLKENAGRRRANDQYIRTYFAHVAGCEPFISHESLAPWRSAIRFESPDRASEVYGTLREAGVEAEAWPPDLPQEASAPDSSGAWLRSRIITLPCHQGLTPERLDAVFSKLKL